MSDSTWGMDEQIWRTIPPPLVPCDADMLLYRQLAGDVLANNPSPRILVLGVTPALIDADWPGGASIEAVDYDKAMIDLLWHTRPDATCHCATWQDMPLDTDSFDLVLGDCSLNALPGVAEYAQVLDQIDRVRTPGAPLVMRFFMRPDPQPALADLREHIARDFDGLRPSATRLLINMTATDTAGSVNLAAIWGRLEEQADGAEDYLASLGHSPEETARSRRIYTSDQYLNYPDRSQIERELSRVFSKVSFHLPDYDCGAVCPIIKAT